MHSFIYSFTHSFIKFYKHTYTPTYVHTYFYIHTCIHSFIHSFHHSIHFTYIPTYLPTYVHNYLHTYIHSFIHTYIHSASVCLIVRVLNVTPTRLGIYGDLCLFLGGPRSTNPSTWMWVKIWDLIFGHWQGFIAQFWSTPMSSCLSCSLQNSHFGVAPGQTGISQNMQCTHQKAFLSGLALRKLLIIHLFWYPIW